MDYLGIFDDVAQALEFDEKAVQQVVSNIDELARTAARGRCRSAWPSSPAWTARVGGYEGLIAAQQCLPNNDDARQFAAEYSVLGTHLGGALARPVPRPVRKGLPLAVAGLRVGEAAQRQRQAALACARRQDDRADPPERPCRRRARRPRDAGAGRRGAGGDARRRRPDKKAKEIEIKLIARLRKHLGNPKFKALGERLEELKERHEQGFLTSLEFLKELLELAKEVVEAEKEADPRKSATAARRR